MTKKRIVIFPFPAQKRVICLLVALLILMLFPFLEMISTALKSRTELLAFPPQWLPKSLQFMNFLSVWVYVPFGRYFINSSIIALGATTLNALVSIPAGYALARLVFPGRRVFMMLVLGTQMFSPVVLLVALFKLMNQLHLLNTHISLIIANAVVTLPLSVWLMTAYFATIPIEIQESALIDGAGWFRIFYDHYLRLAIPGIITTMTFTFILSWNEFLYALTFISDANRRPLTTGIFAFVGRSEIQWNYLMAGSVTAIIPVFILFLIIQKRLVSGMTSGSIR